MLDRLPSWNDGPAKSAIEKFIQATTDPASPDFVPEDERSRRSTKTERCGSNTRS